MITVRWWHMMRGFGWSLGFAAGYLAGLTHLDWPALVGVWAATAFIDSLVNVAIDRRRGLID